MEQKEIPAVKEGKPTSQNIIRKPASAIRKDSEKCMKTDGTDQDGNRITNIAITVRDGESKEGQIMQPKVPKKIINNWRQACDKTKDKTKELLKKWRTMPEASENGTVPAAEQEMISITAGSGWSEHVWTTWVKRIPNGEDSSGAPAYSVTLTDFQRKKLSHFFIFFLDLDRDDVISLADFEAFSEVEASSCTTCTQPNASLRRLRHFSDWSKSSSEYNRLKEVQRSFIETFFLQEESHFAIYSYEELEKKLNKQQLSLEQWLEKWNEVLDDCGNYLQLPLWLQYFPKILFNVINRSGMGIITKDELRAFYTSIVGLPSMQVEGFIDNAFRALTSNEEQPLQYATFRLCFANFLLGRYPNGPGQYLFGPITGLKASCFPIDFKALCYAPEDLEQYSPMVKTNRRSVIV